jgi:hypothetical protein
MDDEGPALGEGRPPIAGQDLEGNTVTVGGQGAEQFLLFVSPACMVCEQVLRAFSSLMMRRDGRGLSGGNLITLYDVSGAFNSPL